MDHNYYTPVFYWGVKTTPYSLGFKKNQLYIVTKMCAYCVKFKNPLSLSDFQDSCVGVICSTIQRGNFLHLKTLPTAHHQTTDELSLPHHCWRQTLYSTGRLIRLGIPPPPPSLQSPCGTSLGCDVNVISFHMALQRVNVTAESCSAFSLLSLPTFLSAACLSVLVWMGGVGGGVS